MGTGPSARKFVYLAVQLNFHIFKDFSLLLGLCFWTWCGMFVLKFDSLIEMFLHQTDGTAGVLDTIFYKYRVHIT